MLEEMDDIDVMSSVQSAKGKPQACLQTAQSGVSSFGIQSYSLNRSSSKRQEDGRRTMVPKNKGGMFVNAVEMKEKMRAQLAKPVYDVRNFYKKTGPSQYIARHAMFDRVSLVVIAFNAFWISVDTDYNDSSLLYEADWPFQCADHFFCGFFFSEWLIRFFAFERKRDGLQDAWFVFDGIMVTLMVAETWIMTAIIYLSGVEGGSMGSTGVLKLIRLTRLTRMARMARLLRAMPELLVLLKGIWAATRSVFFTLLLLFIIIYIFGIAFTQITGGSEAGDMYFRSVPQSMHTLLLRGTLMDEMLDVIELLDESSRYHVYPGFFYLFILISSLTVMNMLIGVLCEVVAAVAATEKEEASVAFVKWQIRDIMKKGGLDMDGDGMISKSEFVQILDNPVATKTLSHAGVDVFGLVDCADFIFDSEDVSDAGLSFADFMEVVLQLRGTNVATVKDIVDLRKFLSVECKGLHEVIQSINRRVTRLAEVPLPRESEAHFKPKATRSVSTRSVADCKEMEQDDQAIVAQTVVNYPPASKDVQAEPSVQVIEPINEDKALYAHLLDYSDAPGRVESLPADLHEVCKELDHLREYVDTELHSIASDIQKRIQGWVARVSHCGDAAVVVHSSELSPRSLPPKTNICNRLCDNQTPPFHEALAAHRSSSCSATCSVGERSTMMMPGAELRRVDAGDRRGIACGMPL